MNENQFDAIVIGSGVGGLATAISLGQHGYKVLVLEQHYVPGGWSHSFTINGHRFSPGVHYVGQLGEGEGANKMYCDLGIANDLVFFRMNKNGFEHCHVGDRVFDYPAGTENIIKKLSERFPDESEYIDKYVRLVERVNNQIQLMPTLKTVWEKVTAPFRTHDVGKYGLFSLNRVINWHLKDPFLKAYLNVQCGDHGLPPKKASFPVHCAVMGHYLNGAYYPLGGGGGIVKAMTTAVKKQNGIVKTETGVKKIILNEAKEAIGVETDSGEKYYSNTIVSNADPHKTYFGLIGKDNLSKSLVKKLNKTKYSVTSLILFLTLEIDLTELKLDSGNYWLVKNENLDNHFEELTNTDVTKGDTFPTVFMSCTTLKDPASYDGKHHNFEIVTYVSYDCMKPFENLKDYHNAEYKEFKEKVTNKMMNNVEQLIPNAREHAITVELGTPKTNQYYIDATDGNVYGTEKSLMHVGPLAYKNRTEIKNLYLAGSSTLSHGVTGATSSGVNAAANILGIDADKVLTPKEDQFLRIYDADNPETWPEWVNTKRATKARRTKV
ncbi:MAG: phytoene dehydrogenase [Fluviicola sp.]|nr:MAG: phytoene dehydrogenase [Fluviicola sp.]